MECDHNAGMTNLRAKRSRLSLLILGITSTLLTVLPAAAAERISFRYGLFEVSISVEDLETFVREGELEGSLDQPFLQFSPTQQAQLRELLQARYEVDLVRVSRFTYTSSGEQLLREAGTLLQTTTGQNGFYAIRAALVLAAADPQGLSIINVLRQFPTNIRIDIGQLLKLTQQFSSLVEQTQQLIARLEERTATVAASAPPIDFNQLPELREPGNFQVYMQTLTFQDTTRDRTLAVDLYLPEKPQTSKISVIVVSNGLGAKRARFDYLGKYLASHGFAVAIPDHPGSDRQRLKEFYLGIHRENFEAREFINRPLDITFLLDKLEQLNSPRFGNRLDLERVGVFGYSFGGTTALSLAGAKIDFQHLERNCETQPAIFNISLLYQCRALELSRDTPNLRDKRIQAVYVFVPFSKSLFGQKGMSQVSVPVFWEATAQDILTPFVVEQIPAFRWLTGVDKYLAVPKGLPHAKVTLNVINRSTGQAVTWKELQPIARLYHKTLSLAFLKRYVAGDKQYRPYLRAAYMELLTEKPYRLSLVRSLLPYSSSKHLTNNNHKLKIRN
jgi:predicted dienelactone hydrolase